MKLRLIVVVFAALVVNANCNNDNNDDIAEIRAKMGVMERHLAEVDALKSRVAALEQQQGKVFWHVQNDLVCS